MIGKMSSSMWLLFFALIMSILTTVRAEEHTDPEVVILFMFFGLGIGIITMQILSAMGDPLPYTVVVFTAGLLFSLFSADNAGTKFHLSFFSFSHEELTPRVAFCRFVRTVHRPMGGDRR